MSTYKIKPIDFTRLKTVPLQTRGGKVRAEDFAAPYVKGGGFQTWLDSLPKILAGDSFRAVVNALVAARDQGKPILWGLGGHVIKCGLAPVLIDLMDRGLVTGVALNGSGIVHDYEIALIGSTSEDVEAQLAAGAFGMAEETARGSNGAI